MVNHEVTSLTSSGDDEEDTRVRLPKMKNSIHKKKNGRPFAKCTCRTKRPPDGNRCLTYFNIAIKMGDKKVGYYHTDIRGNDFLRLSTRDKNGKVKTGAKNLWLNDNILDAYFQILQRNHPDKHYVESTWWPLLEQGKIKKKFKEKFGDDGKESYVIINPSVKGKNTQGSHWVLLKLVPGEKQAFVYDSLPGNNNFGTVKRRFKFFADSWTWTRVVSPQQENEEDCGVFVCMNAFTLTHEKPFYSQRNVRQFRMRIAHDILTGTESLKYPPECPLRPRK